MPIEFVHAFLATGADTYPDGRFAVIGGGFDAIEVPAFPIMVPVLVVVARVRIPVEEAARPHHIRAEVIRPNGTSLRVTAATTISDADRPGPRIGPLERGMITNVIINLFNVTFDVGGVYGIRFLEGDVVFGTLEVPIVDTAGMSGA